MPEEWIKSVHMKVSIMSEVDFAKIAEDAQRVIEEYFSKTNLKPGQILVIGCSTSEVRGNRIGKDGNSHIAEAIYQAFAPKAAEKGVYLAFQCCEHLNRALVVEREAAEKDNLTEVSVVPYPHAGGSMASWAYRAMKEPVVVETIQAHGGIDIGETLIGMHLKAVAVPLHLENRYIGAGRINCAFSRPKLIGGIRAKYTVNDENEPCVI